MKKEENNKNNIIFIGLFKVFFFSFNMNKIFINWWVVILRMSNFYSYYFYILNFHGIKFWKKWWGITRILIKLQEHNFFKESESGRVELPRGNYKSNTLTNNMHNTEILPPTWQSRYAQNTSIHVHNFPTIILSFHIF